MTREEQDTILNLYPIAVSWFNTVRDDTGKYLYSVYGVFVPNCLVDEVLSLLDSRTRCEEFGSDTLIRGF